MDQEGGKRSGVTVKTLKRVLKKAGLKVSGKKSTLTRRAKKARLMGGGPFGEALKNAAKSVATAGLDKLDKMGDQNTSTTTSTPSTTTGGRRRKH